MRKFISLVIFVSVALHAYSQTRVMINNDGFIVIDNSAFVVIENPNPNAITTLGTGGNIISEDETDVIQWEIGTTTGTYTIPWTTSAGFKIPLVINKTTAGTGATSEFILSTWETATDLNIPLPSAVNNMNYNAVDRSLYVSDRFWHIDALSYSAKPDVTLTIGYDPGANSIGGTNTIIEANLLAQRFNTALNHWEAYKLFGVNDAANDRVIAINAPAADFFEDWIVVDQSNPLPVTLTTFDAQCEGGEIEITWTTETEVNNDYFVIEKSYDGTVFFELATVQGQGNSTVPTNYSYSDGDNYTGPIYYRLKQVDFDAATTYFNVVATNCEGGGFQVTNLLLNNGTLGFDIHITERENLTLYFYDYRGRLIFSDALNASEGTTSHSFNNLQLSTGIYMLSIVGERNNYSVKLLSK